MKRAFLAVLRTLAFVLPLSLCIVSCEEFDLEEIFGNIIKPSGGDEAESEEYVKDLILRELAEMEVGFICDPNYAEGADSYLFTNGLAMSVSSDSVLGYFVLIDSLDLAEAVWTESKRISIHLDSLYRPVLAVSADSKMLFDYNSDESFSVTSYANDGTAKEVDIPYRQQSATRASTRSSGLDGICNGLNILGIAQNGLGGNSFGHVNFLANMFSKALPEGLPQDFASLTLSGISLTPRVAAFLAKQFGYAAGGPLGWAVFVATGIKTVQDLCNWLVEQKIGQCKPGITSVTLAGKNSVDVRVGFISDGLVHDDTPMYYIQYWQEIDGRRVKVCCTDDKKVEHDFSIETISGLTGGKYGFQIILYPSSFYNNRSVLNFESNIAYKDISPLYLSEVVQEDASYYDGLLTISMKTVTEYLSDEDRVVLSHYDDYGVYVQKGTHAKECCSSKVNKSNEYYINLDFKKSDLDINVEDFKCTPLEAIKFGVYTKDGFGFVKYYDEQDVEISYTDNPDAMTGELVTVSENTAVVKCEYEDCLLWDVQRGVEYFTDTESESLVLGANEEDGNHEFSLEDLKSNTTYRYRAYYDVNGVREYGETKSFKTDRVNFCPDHNHPHMIDLGLPSGTKWACCNVGADVPEGYGGYYAWGETEEKNSYTLETYKYYLGDLNGDGWYCDEEEWLNIGSNISGTSYDVAHVKWGGSWRMPTLSEVQEFWECSWEWTTVNGVSGQKVTGPNGKSIFFPAAGCREGTKVQYRGSSGGYWSGTLNHWDAYVITIERGGVHWIDYGRSHGRTVRPVIK
ncbi:MAG: hypothetical protein IJ290_05640 [Bacteroidaceae bacterium]|nr:hypothetical protein [Bacteroidaceae bacterium]